MYLDLVWSIFRNGDFGESTASTASQNPVEERPQKSVLAIDFGSGFGKSFTW